MHAQGPLQAHKGAFDGRKDEQRERHGQWQPDHRMEPEGRPVGHLDYEHQAHHDVADNDDGEIGRRVVGAVVMQLFAAGGAGVGHLQIAPEHGTAAAGRAAQTRAAQERAENRAGVL